MKYKYFFIIFFITVSCCIAYGKYEQNYTLTKNPEINSLRNNLISSNEEILFILDYSNSMNEILINSTKYDMLLESIKSILHKLSPSNKIGVRLYGQRYGFTPLDACRATNLVIPIGVNNIRNIPTILSKYSPKGMTPITYSLKQAVKKDLSHDMSINKHIILITDGGENCDESPCTYAMELIKYRKDIKIDVIAFNIDNDDDLDQLECVAKVTKGKIYSAETKAELMKSLNNIFNADKKVDAKIIGQ